MKNYMNSLRISQSCYAQLTSVYTMWTPHSRFRFNVNGIVEFQLDKICFVLPVNVWQERVNRWINGCRLRVGIICFIAHYIIRTWMTWFSRWSIWCKSESIHSYNVKNRAPISLSQNIQRSILFSLNLL